MDDEWWCWISHHLRSIKSNCPNKSCSLFYLSNYWIQLVSLRLFCNPLTAFCTHLIRLQINKHPQSEILTQPSRYDRIGHLTNYIRSMRGSLNHKIFTDQYIMCIQHHTSSSDFNTCGMTVSAGVNTVRSMQLINYEVQNIPPPCMFPTFSPAVSYHRCITNVAMHWSCLLIRTWVMNLYSWGLIKMLTRKQKAYSTNSPTV